MDGLSAAPSPAQHGAAMLAVITLILVAAVLTLGVPPAPLHAAGSKAEPRKGPGSESSKQAKPKPPDAKQGPGYRPGQVPSPRELLEERLRRGQMEEPSAQGEVSDRLEQFYRNPPDAPEGQVATEQPESK